MLFNAKLRIIIALLLAALSTAGCSKQEVVQPPILSAEGIEETCVETITWENVITESWN